MAKLEVPCDETEFEVDTRHRVQLQATARVVLPFLLVPSVLWWLIGIIYIQPEDFGVYRSLLPLFLLPSLALLAPIVLGGSRLGWTRLLSVQVSTSGFTTTRQIYCGRRQITTTIPLDEILGIHKSRSFVTIQVKTPGKCFTNSVPILLFGLKDGDGLVQLGQDLKLKSERSKYPTLESLLGQEQHLPPNWKRKSTT